VICHQQYFGQIVNKFSTRWSSHRSNWNKPDNEDDKDQMASRHCSVFDDIVNKPPIHELALLLLQNNPVFTLWIPVKINILANLTHKLIFKAWSTLVWNNSYSLFVVFFEISHSAFSSSHLFWPFSPPSDLAMLITPYSANALFESYQHVPCQRECIALLNSWLQLVLQSGWKQLLGNDVFFSLYLTQLVVLVYWF